MRSIINEIGKQKNLEKNLRAYAEGMERTYADFSRVRFAINYFSFYEWLSESPAAASAVAETVSPLHTIVKNTLLSDAAAEEEYTVAVGELHGVRERLIETMKTVTAYVDIFYIYQYVLDRQEYRFREPSFKQPDDETFTRDLMRYIVSDEDHAVINRKIEEVIGQLPIRLTKQKFFEYLDAALSLYKGNDKRALDDFLYSIRSSAMIEIPETYAEDMSDLYGTLQMVMDMDMSQIDKPMYDRLQSMMRDATDYLAELSDAVVSATELVNDALVLALAFDAKPETKTDAICMQIIKEIQAAITGDGGNTEEASDLLVMLEGEQEALMEQINRECFLIEEWNEAKREELKEYGVSEAFERLSQMTLLTSGSIFVDLADTVTGELVEESYLNEKKEELRNDLTELFAARGKRVTRAVMATLLSKLPVFFENLKELQDFVYQTLSQCRDRAEKLMCMEELMGVIDEADD